MKDSEAVALYHQAISVTPGEPTEFGADMWCDLLRDLRYEDAREGLINLLRRSTFVSPAEIRAEVKRIRAKRTDVNDADLIPPDYTTPEAYRAWMVEARRRLADGETVAEINGAQGEMVSRNLTALGMRNP